MANNNLNVNALELGQMSPEEFTTLKKSLGDTVFTPKGMQDFGVMDSKQFGQLKEQIGQYNKEIKKSLPV